MKDTFLWFHSESIMPNLIGIGHKVVPDIASSHVTIAESKISMRKIICQLPVDFCRSAFSTFLTIADITRLDSSLLIHDCRKQIQERYSDIFLSCPDSVIMSSDAASWLAARRISLPRLTFTSMCLSSDDALQRAIKVTSKVESLQFERQSKLHTSNVGELLHRNSGTLLSLSLQGCDYDPQMLIAIRASCPKLRDIDLSFTRTSLHDMLPLLQSCKQIVTINLSDCPAIDDAAVGAIATACVNLHDLNLENCSACTDNAILALAEHCPGLRQLNVMGWDKLTDRGIVELSKSCAQLRGIHLLGSDNISQHAVLSLALHCSQLEEVTLLHCPRIHNDSLVTLAQRCPQLRSLSCHGNKAALCALAVHCPRLSSLMVYRPHKTSGEALYELLEGCTELKSLNVSRFYKVPSRGRFLCSALKVLDLSRCPDRADEEVVSLVQHLSGLEELYLQGCEQLTDDSVVAAAQCCPALRVVDLAGLQSLTDESAVALALLCPQLRQVNLHGCDRLTDRAVVTLAQHCLMLTHLNLSVCERTESLFDRACRVLGGAGLGDASLVALAKHCGRLRELRLLGRTGFTAKALGALQKALPTCKLVCSL